MTFPWETEAKKNAPMPPGLPQADQLAYQSIALLVGRYRMGLVSADQAVRERKEIDAAYVKATALDGYRQWTVRFHKGVQVAHSKYRKERTLENADLLSDVIDGFVRL